MRTLGEIWGEFTLEVYFGVGEGGVQLLGILAIHLKHWVGGIERGSIVRTYCATPGVSVYSKTYQPVKIIHLLMLVVSCFFWRQ